MSRKPKVAELAAGIDGTARLPDAALFDLDDTILATSEGANSAWVAVTDRFAPVLVAMGHRIAPEMLRLAIHEYRVWFWSDAERNRVGRLNPCEALRQNVRGGLEKLGVAADPDLTEEMAAAWTAVRWDACRPIEGAIETLQVLRARGVKLGLITNGSADVQRKKVEHLGLPDLMDHIQIEGAFGVGKPEPRAYAHALDTLGTGPDRAWMVGDNLEFDVLAPMRMGIRGIWVDGEGEGLPGDTTMRPNRIVRAISELV